MGELGRQRNMAGADESYTHAPMFYSDLFELGYEAVGELNIKLEMATDWQDGFNKGRCVLPGNRRVRGVRYGMYGTKVPARARELLAAAWPI